MENKHHDIPASPTESHAAAEITEPILMLPYRCSLDEIRRQIRDIIASASDASDSSTSSGHYGLPGTGRSPSLPEYPDGILL